MEDMLICTILRFIWFPIAFISLTTIIFLVFKYLREDDILEKDRIGSKIKYPVIILFLALIAIPGFDYAIQNDMLPFECKPPTPVQPSCSILTKFSDGSTTKKISFPKNGGLNSETNITIPRGVNVDKVRIEIEHPSRLFLWMDEFSNWTKIDSYSGMSIDEDESYAFINISRLEVDSTIVLDGSHTFDEVYIKEGGMITTSVGKKLDLKVRGKLIIDKNSGINVDGKGNSEKGKGGNGKSTGVAYFGPLGSGGGGGGYGGKGGNGGNDETTIAGSGGMYYGSKEEPSDLGSIGGNGGAASGEPGSGLPGAGGLGGGAVKIEAKEIILNGYISADGNDGEDSAENDGTGGGGGGSGGSIFIITDNLRLNGRITANGGNGGNDRQKGRGIDGGGGGGSGGRISILYSIKSGSGEVSVMGGKTGSGHKGDAGEEGTITWKKKPISFSSLIYSNITSVKINPDNLKSWGKFYANATVPGGSEIQYRILNASDNSTLCKIKQEDALSGYNISSCASNTEAIRLHASMITVSTSITPLLHYWKIYYDTEIKNLKLDIGLDRTMEYVNPSFSGRTTISDDNTNPRISEKITSLLKDCDCRGCSLSGDKCTINLRFFSESSGTLILENPRLEYCIPQ